MTSVLSDPSELLFRQAPAAFFRDNRLSSQAFTPGRNDEGLLSVARSSLTTAQASFELHTLAYGREPVGTWAVSVGECGDEQLPVRPDPLTEPVDNPAHALVDFTGLSKKQMESKAQALVARARARGRLWPASGG